MTKKTIAFLLSKFLNKKDNLWIIGASGGRKYTDNGAILYRYIQKNYPEINIYWIINKNSEELTKAKKDGPILYKGSVRGNLYSLLAKVIICTHSFPKDISTYKTKRYEDTLKVFISHGIEGFKDKNPEHIQIHKTYDISVSVSDFEKSIKVDKWGLDNNKVCITGLPRYDGLEKDKENKKKIFYMPTWRPEYRDIFEKPFSKLTNTEIDQFKNTEYYKNVVGFLLNPLLEKFLEKNEMHIDVFFHQMMHKFMSYILKDTAPSRINILPVKTNIQKTIMQSTLFVTDYSSVCWDFLYLQRPVVFYQFDQKDYFERTGTYMKIPDDLFGPVTYSPEETVNEISDIINEKKNYTEIQREAKQRFFKYHDKENCKRMTECILKKLQEKIS